VIAYASQTSGENRERIKAAGWRQFVSPDTWAKNGDPVSAYALDNDAWGSFKNNRPWNRDGFMGLAERLGPGADFVVIPDVVTDAKATLALAERWIYILGSLTLYLAVQDGMVWSDVLPFVGSIVGGVYFQFVDTTDQHILITVAGQHDG